MIVAENSIPVNPEETEGVVSFRGRGHKSAKFEMTVRFDVKEDSSRKTQGPIPIPLSAIKASQNYMSTDQGPFS